MWTGRPGAAPEVWVDSTSRRFLRDGLFFGPNIKSTSRLGWKMNSACHARCREHLEAIFYSSRGTQSVIPQKHPVKHRSHFVLVLRDPHEGGVRTCQNNNKNTGGKKSGKLQAGRKIGKKKYFYMEETPSNMKRTAHSRSSPLVSRRLVANCKR